jgi:ribosome-associated protein
LLPGSRNSPMMLDLHTLGGIAKCRQSPNCSTADKPHFARRTVASTISPSGTRLVPPERVNVEVSSVDRPARLAPSLERALVAAQVAADNRGRNIVVLDMRELTSVFDYFVVASGTSRRQLHAISEEIDRTLEKILGDRRMGIEGYEQSRWILLDYGDVVIHLFDDETRSYYSLEDLWAQAKRVPFEPRQSRSP